MCATAGARRRRPGSDDEAAAARRAAPFPAIVPVKAFFPARPRRSAPGAGGGTPARVDPATGGRDFRRVAEPASLRAAWDRVRANGGAAGGDGVSGARFAERLDSRLAALREDLVSGRYRPGPLRAAALPKRGGGVRALRIPCVRDRIAQTACHMFLLERLDPEMSDLSFAYRPGRSVAKALARARLFARRRPWVVDADIEAFFDSVPHGPLIAELPKWVDDAGLRRLIAVWVRGFGGSRGLAQGAPISPLLANFFLEPLDRKLAAAGFPIVRYADDFLVFARGEAEGGHALRAVEAALRRRGLRLSATKSAVRRVGPDLVFLGEPLCAEADGAAEIRRNDNPLTRGGKSAMVGCFGARGRGR